ncbi:MULTISPECIES: MbtH family protein [unclassified Nonomuraea]|uniref:MbtH family protein n=1 Tax=unclassified Nonomuraea TaxID=2593643 RepID=UPI0035C099C3
MTDAHAQSQIYQVVVNHEEQYSIWPAQQELPGGWRPVGKTGPKGDCLDYITELWTDMRPLSLRLRMDDPQGEHNDAGLSR